MATIEYLYRDLGLSVRFTKGCGIVPMRWNEGSIHEVSKFNNVLDSVGSYIHNLNANTSYEG